MLRASCLNSIADWLETETDQNWVYNGGTGWDDVATLDPEQVYGPSAEDIRNFVDYTASSSSEAAMVLFNKWGTPNYEAFNYIAGSVEHAMSNPYSDRKKDSDRPVSIASANTDDFLFPYYPYFPYYNISNTTDNNQSDEGEYDFLFPSLKFFNTPNNNQTDEDKWEGYRSIHAEMFFEFKEKEKIKEGLYIKNNYLTLEQMEVNAQYIYDYLLDKGWTSNAISALLGNMQTESTINPGIWQDFKEGNMKGGFGLVQWTPSRGEDTAQFWTWADEYNLDPKDIDTQLERIQYEVEKNVQWQGFRTDYNMTFEEFTQSTESVEVLTRMFMLSYERPADKSEKVQAERSRQGKYWYDYFN